MQAFKADVAVGAPRPGGPPGYASPEWHRRALGAAQVFRLVEDGTVVGGAIVWEKSATWAELARVWLVPQAQGRGVGTEVLRQLEGMFARVTRWTLDTPVWNLRNQLFYRACGYREVRRDDQEVVFEKTVAVD